MPKLNLITTKRMKNSLGEITRLKNAGFQWTRPELLDFYGLGEGRIPFHMSTKALKFNNSGQVIGYHNLAGLGEAASGNCNPKPFINGMVGFDGTVSPFIIDSNISSVNSRILFVAQFTGTGTGDNILGSSTHAIRIGTIQTGDMVGMGFSRQGATYSPLPRFLLERTQPVLMEVDHIPTAFQVYKNGVQSSNPYTNVNNMNSITNLMFNHIGNSFTGSPFTGFIGDIVQVTLGAGSDTVIQATREYLADLYGITLGG